MTFGRVMPQATLTPILLGKGLTYEGILGTQIVYMVVLVLAEFPSGYLADRLSRKYVYLAAIAFTGAAYAVVWGSSGLLPMCLAWALYALGSAMLTSTLDVHFASLLRDDDRRFRAFFSTDRNIVLGASIVAAGLSSLVYGQLGDRLYAISLGAFVVALVAGALVLPGGRDDLAQVSSRAEASHRVTVRAALRADPRILQMVVLFGLSQVAFTPFFQLWQMIALDARLSPQTFGFIFIVLQLMNILANVVFRHIPHRRVTTYGLLAMILVIGVVGSGLSESGALLLVFAIPAPLFLYANQLEFSLQSIAPASTLSSLGSLMGTAGTALSMLTLAVTLWGVTVFHPSLVLSLLLAVFAAVSTALLVAVSRRSARTCP